MLIYPTIKMSPLLGLQGLGGGLGYLAPKGAADTSSSTSFPGAVSFDGSGDYLTVPSSSDLTFGTGDFTVEMWVYANNFTHRNTFYDSRVSDAVTGMVIGSEASTGQLKVYMNPSSGNDQIVDSTDFSTGSWYHVAVTCDSTTVRLFVNGVLKDTGTGRNLSNTDPVNIGYKTFTGSSYDYLDGFISNVRVLKGTALYTTAFTPPTEPLTDVTNTKLLCCQSNTSANLATVSPATFSNDGTVWSSTSTISSGGAASGKPLTNGFDGSTSTLFEGDTTNATATVPVSATISAGGVRVWAAVTSSTPLVVLIKNGGTTVETITGSNSGGQWYASSSYAGAITSLVISRTGRAPEFNSIEINGCVLIDGLVGEAVSQAGDPATITTSLFNGAIKFDGTGDYLTIADTNSEFSFGSGDFTIEGFIYPTGVNSTTYAAIFTTGISLQLYFMSSNSLSIYMSSNGSGYNIVGNSNATGTNTIFQNEWSHVAFTRNGNDFKLFINGVAYWTLTSTATIFDDANPFGIGDYTPSPGSYEFQGYMSNVRVVKGSAVYTANFTPPTAPLTTTSQGVSKDNVMLLACNTKVPSAAYMSYTTFDQAFSSNPTIVGGSLSNASNAFNGGSGDWANLTATSTSTAASVDFVFPKSLTNVTRIEAAFDSPSGSGDTRGRYNGANGGDTRSGTGSGWSDIYNGGAITVTSVGYGINQNGQTGTNNEILSRFRVTIGGTATILVDFIKKIDVYGDPIGINGPFSPPIYSDYAYGDFTRPAERAFDGRLSTRAEPHDSDTVYFDFSHVNPTGTLLNYDNNSRIPTYYDQGGFEAGAGLRSNPIINAFDGNSSTYCDLTYNNGQFTRLNFENPITNVTNITIGYDGEGDPGYNGGNSVTNVSFSGGRQTVQIYNGGAITLNNLNFISQGGNGVCRLYDVTITTTTQSATELTIDGGVTASSTLEMYMTKAGSPGSSDWTVNGASLGGSVPSHDWVNVGNLLGSYPVKLKNIALYHNSGSSSVELFAIKVDGSILTDSV